MRSRLTRLARVVLAAVVAVAVAVPAAARPAVAVGAVPQTAPSFNGSVYAIAARGDTVYVGGSFTAAIVAGKQVARQRLAAFDARTGALLAWAPTADATVRALAADDVGVYAGGDFGVVSGVRRDSLARLDPVSGAVGSFAHQVGGVPLSLAVGNGRLYTAGTFTDIDGAARAHVAAFALSTGALDPGWTAGTDDTVYALAVVGERVYLGGSFHKANNVSSTLRLTAVTATTGAVVTTFKPSPPAVVYGIAVDAAGVYAAMGGQGGRAAAYTSTGALRWLRVFDGDAQSIAVLAGTVYVGGHFDRACTTNNNGPQGVCTDGSVSRIKFAAITATGTLSGWAPQANGIVGVRTLLSDPAHGTVSAGGDFTTIGGLPCKRYASFG
ncbi:hypothetical protein [Krasilnikovia sp. M28-CT-15]|uniref:hypothetical protein n=1 Tax=Krasilnikovia sp. M28-CT-15 TaxID=3373540 RepID=UPI00399CA509